MKSRVALIIIKLTHTLAWFFFVLCIFAIPFFAKKIQFKRVLIASGFMILELLALLSNSMRCPLTDIAANFTDDRSANFDIYIPEIIARYNKEIFGPILTAAWSYSIYKWVLEMTFVPELVNSTIPE